MNKRNLILAGGGAALSLALIALPGFSAKKQVEKQKVQRSAPTVIELDEPEVIELPDVAEGERPQERAQRGRCFHPGQHFVNRAFPQRVHIVDANGEAWEALYTLEQQPDGSLKITGCSLLKAGQAV